MKLIDNSPSSVFMLVGILGLFAGGIFTYFEVFPKTYGFVMIMFFGIMFVAGLIGITPKSK